MVRMRGGKFEFYFTVELETQITRYSADEIFFARGLTYGIRCLHSLRKKPKVEYICI